MDEIEFINSLKRYLPTKEIDQLIEAINNNLPISSLIIDEEKITKEQMCELFPFLRPHPVVPNSFLFNKSLHSLGKELLFEIGAYYILEPCSSLVAYFLNPTENDLVLDMASAPGGKAIHSSFLMKNKGQIIANEINYERAKILSSNVEKYGRKNIVVTNDDCGKLVKQFKNYFTKIILDAPCSGSGMFRKDIKMKEDWTLAKVQKLASIQKELILNAFDMLAPGGEMIYSTCSFSFEEDEDVISYLLNNRPAELVELPHFNGEYRGSLPQTIHLFPHRFNGEGHFIAKIKKRGNCSYPCLSINNKHFHLKFINESIKEIGQLYLTKTDDVYLTNFSIPLQSLHVLRQGIKLGHLDTKLGLIYDHSLGRTNLSILPRIDLNIDECKSYIYGLSIPHQERDGYYVLTYLNIPFAITKVVKNILKNHYPKGLRKKL